MSRDHEITASCWCHPTICRPCLECDVTPEFPYETQTKPDCWACRGTGLIETAVGEAVVQTCVLIHHDKLEQP